MIRGGIGMITVFSTRWGRSSWNKREKVFQDSGIKYTEKLKVTVKPESSSNWRIIREQTCTALFGNIILAIWDKIARFMIFLNQNLNLVRKKKKKIECPS